MVNVHHIIVLANHQLILAQKAAEPVLERMKPSQRAGVLFTLLGVTLVGLLLIVLTMFAGHWVRRLARQRPSRGQQKGRAADAGDLQLRKSLESFLPEAKTDDTIQFGKSSPETKIGG
jgi:hypothetical protein